MRPVTDPNILQQLEGIKSNQQVSIEDVPSEYRDQFKEAERTGQPFSIKLKPVTDPNLIAQLETGGTSQPKQFDRFNAIKQTGDLLAGTAETAASLTTGAIGGMAGLAGGIGATAIFGNKIGKEFREYVSDFYTYKPKSESGKGAMSLIGKVTKPLSYPRQVATGLGGEQWGNLADVATLGLLSKTPEMVSAIKKAPQKAGKFFYRKSLQPSGTAVETEAMTETGFKGKFWLDKKGEAHFKEVKGAFDRTLNQVIKSGEGQTRHISQITGALDDLANGYGGYTMKPLTDRKAIMGMKKQVETEWLTKYPDGQIPIAEIQKLKTTQYLRQKSSYGEVKKAMESESAKALARASKNTLEEILPDLQKVNPHEKNLIQFGDEFDKALVRNRNERMTITNLTLDNKFLLTKLSQVFRTMSPDHIFADVTKLKAYLKDIPSPTIAQVYNNAQIEWSRQMGMEDVSGQPSSQIPPLVQPTTRAIGYDRATTPIKLGMEDVSGQGRTLTIKDARGRDIVVPEKIQAEFNNPEFWKKNQDLINLRLKMKNREPILSGEWNEFLNRIMLKWSPKTPTPKDWGKGKNP